MKRPTKPHLLALLLIGALMSTLPVDAQQAKSTPAKPTSETIQGQVTKGFTLPQYNDGKLTAMISGAEARVISVNRTEVKGLKVELYENGTVTTTITSPQSDYWSGDNKMLTRFGVQIVRNEMTVTAQNMVWEIEKERGVLRNNVKVILNNLDLATPSPHPAAPRTTPAPGAEAFPTLSESSPLQLQQTPSAPSTLLPQ